MIFMKWNYDASLSIENLSFDISPKSSIKGYLYIRNNMYDAQFCSALGPLNISKVSLSGVDAAISKHMSEDTEYKGVKAHFRVDESGILYLDEVRKNLYIVRQFYMG